MRQTGIALSQFLIVVALLIIVAAIALAPRLLGQSEKGKHTQAVEELEQIGLALDLYAKDNSDYPTTDQGLKALWEKPTLPPYPLDWKGPYLKVPIIRDPWGSNYIYIRPGIHNRHDYDLISFGADKKEGGTGNNEDIVNWTKGEE